MNAAVRAVARTAFFEGWEVMGVNAGYRGLLEGRIYPMDRRRLGGIVQRGGTVLGTERAGDGRARGAAARGGNPPASDRILASRLGHAAVVRW